MLSEAYQKIVVLDPILLGKLLAKGDLGLFGRLGLDVAPSIGDSMDVRVDADAGFFIAQRHDQICRLSADAFELQKLVNFIGDFSRVIVNQTSANLQNIFCLRFVKADGIDQLLNLLSRKLEHCSRRIGNREQTMRRLRCGGILSTQTENARYENSERALVSLSHQCHDGSLPFRHFAAQNPYDRVNLAVCHCAGLFPADWLD